MGLMDVFKPQQVVPTVSSILPDIAKQEIMKGNLPVLRTDKIFLQATEICHYIDKAIFEKRKVQKKYIRKGTGYSVPGLFKGSRVSAWGGHTDVVDNIRYEPIRGILYITNQRIIFLGESEGFEKKVANLIAITPYANCVEFQFSKGRYKLFVPDGNVINAVLHQVR